MKKLKTVTREIISFLSYLGEGASYALSRLDFQGAKN